MRKLFSSLTAKLQRALLGVSTDEIRYTFEDVRKEIRATRSELEQEIAELRRDVGRLEARVAEDRPEGPELPVAEA